jgi:integrase
MKRANLHMFRHTIATFLANNPGMSLTQVQKFLGHSDITVTMEYVHTNASDVEQGLSRVDFGDMLAASGTTRK